MPDCETNEIQKFKLSPTFQNSLDSVKLLVIFDMKTRLGGFNNPHTMFELPLGLPIPALIDICANNQSEALNTRNCGA